MKMQARILILSKKKSQPDAQFFGRSYRIGRGWGISVLLDALCIIKVHLIIKKIEKKSFELYIKGHFIFVIIGKILMIGKSMTGGAPWKHILFFTFPILAGALLQQFYHTADTIIVGNFAGEAALSAVGTTNTPAFFFLAIAIGFSAGNGVLIAQDFGAERWNELRKSASTGVLFMLLIGAVCSLAGALISPWLYRHFLAVPPEIYEDTVRYFVIYSSGLIFQFAYNSLASILRSVGDSAATLYFLLIASVVNIVLDLLFVAVLHWKVAGAAAATNISQALAVVAAWIYMLKKYPVFRYKITELRWYGKIAADTVKIGLPIALQLVFVALGLTFIQRAVNGFGQVMTASFTVGQRIEMYLHLPCNALQTALATFTGQNVGAKRYDRVKQGAWQGVMLSAGLTLILSAALWFCAGVLPQAFALSEQAAAYCYAHLKAVALIVIILSLYVPLFGVFQGTKNSLVPTIVALCALTLRVIVTYAVKDTAFFGRSIIWWNGLFGFCLGCTITWSIYLSKRFQKRLQPLAEH